MLLTLERIAVRAVTRHRFFVCVRSRVGGTDQASAAAMSFHVPELARDTTHPILGTTCADGNNGAFHLESPEPGWRLALICSDGHDPDVPQAQGWEHVSVHAYRGRGDVQRTPNWREMSYVKDLCWDAEDVVIQFHPRKSEYVNCHPHVLHLWRPTHAQIPMPPPELVGVL